MIRTYLITYSLWLFFGFIGAHHVYLERYKHAVVWLFTFGGFGFGWFRDLWRIPYYIAVNQATENDESCERRSVRWWSPIRLCGQFLTACLTSNICFALALWAIEIVEEAYMVDFQSYEMTVMLLLAVLNGLGMAFGVWIVGSIDNDAARNSASRPLLWTSITAVCVYGISAVAEMWDVYVEALHVKLTAFVVTVTSFHLSLSKHSESGKRPLKSGAPTTRRAEVQSTFWPYLVMFLLLAALYSWFWFHLLCHKTTFPLSDGKSMPVCQVFLSLAKSSREGEDMQTAINRLIEFILHTTLYGSGEGEHFVTDRDRNRALRVLQFDVDVGSRDAPDNSAIIQRYRQLSRKWHPDKFVDPVAKEEAHAKFVQIQEAFNMLDESQRRRQRRRRQNFEAE